MQDVQPKTGVIYCRVSSATQVEGTSLEMQERQCKEYAIREGIEILAIFVEEGESAKTAERTEFKKALSFCASKKHSVGYFIVHKIDRFARNQDDHTMTQMFLRRCGTKLRSVTEPIDDTPLGKFMEGILSSSAQFDNDIRASRSRSGMIERLKRGEWVWAAPYGYKRITKGGSLFINEATAPYVHMVFKEYSKGTHSLHSLAELVAKHGMRQRNGKKPIVQFLNTMLRNPIYYGLLRGLGTEVKGKFEPIISEELFWKCQPRARSKFHGSKKSEANHTYPLRRFTRCTECGQALTGSPSTGRKGKKYHYYHHQKQGCPLAAAIPKETLEQNFVEFLQEISPSGKSEAAFKAVVLDVWQSNFKKLDEDNARLRKEIEALEVERQKVFDAQRAGLYSDDEFKEQKGHVMLTIQSKKSLLEEKRVEEFNMDEALGCCFDWVRDSGKTWVKLADSPVLRARFQKSIFPEAASFDGKKFGTTKTSLVYKLNEGDDPDKTKLVRPLGFEPRTFSLKGSRSTN